MKYVSRYLLGYRMIEFVVYNQDIGNLHVIDYWLHLAASFHTKPSFALPRIGRYLDGEEETEGTYR